MSKIALESNPSGTGTFTIKSPNSNVDRELVLPDEAGTVLTNDSDIEPQVKAATNASGSAPIYACRAWVNFDGTTTTPTIRASGNVSSVTRQAEGFFTINFTTAMPDTNYSPAGWGRRAVSGYRSCIVCGSGGDTKTTSALQIRTGFEGTIAQNFSEVSLIVFR
jgi:hypothetical protein